VNVNSEQWRFGLSWRGSFQFSIWEGGWSCRGGFCGGLLG
jgi:prolipoprotein diacylglyceryltransferase